MTDGWKFYVSRVLRSPRFLAGSSATQDTESFLAWARALLALGFFLLIDINPVFPPQFAQVAYIVVFLYVIHSLLALVSTRYRRSWMPGWKLHLVDVLWVAGVPLFIRGVSTEFYLLYPFLLFVLLAAAYRWGLYETLATAGACLVLVVVVGNVVAAFAGSKDLYSPFEPLGSKDLLERIASVLMTALLVGYLGEREGGLRVKAALIARLREKVHSETSVRETLEAALGAILGIFDADRATLALREEKTRRAYLWQAERTHGTQACTANREDLEPFQHQRYFFSLPGTSCSAIRRPGNSEESFELLPVNAKGERLARVPYTFPAYFATWHKFTSLLVVSFAPGDGKEWIGRLFLFNPRISGHQEVELRFLQDLVGEAGRAVYSVYRLRRLRSRAGAMERARIARELHDGVIQSLIGIEMRMDVLLRQATPDRATADELVQLQRVLRREIINVRELMQQIKSLDLSRGTLLESVGDLVDKFRRDSGISATLVAESEDVALPPLLAREVLRIVGEALTNVRKHSGARNALVRLGYKNGLWKLVIEDDGRGFDFSGRLSQAELDATRKGPAVIKERVHCIGGQLAVESNPGRGSRLEITVAQALQ